MVMSEVGWCHGLKGRIGWHKVGEQGCHCSPLWVLPGTDSWYQRVEVPPLSKMKPLSQEDGEDRKIYQGPGKINIWTGDTARAGSRGGLSVFIQAGSRQQLD